MLIRLPETLIVVLSYYCQLIRVSADADADADAIGCRGQAPQSTLVLKCSIVLRDRFLVPEIFSNRVIINAFIRMFTIIFHIAIKCRWIGCRNNAILLGCGELARNQPQKYSDILL
ncbi:hypothetical protein GQX74_008347 [Glossina fuscipes]|nr:hypothetical protein GQX74_008347 [Glossina fuscipes]